MKNEKLYDKTNLKFREILDEKFQSKFGIEIKTYYNIFSLGLISERVDGLDFTVEQRDWMNIFEDGYISCMDQIY